MLDVSPCKGSWRLRCQKLKEGPGNVAFTAWFVDKYASIMYYTSTVSEVDRQRSDIPSYI